MQTHHLFALLPLLCTGLVMAQDKAAAAPPPTVNTVMVQALPEYPAKEVLMITVEYPPGGADPFIVTTPMASSMYSKAPSSWA